MVLDVTDALHVTADGGSTWRALTPNFISIANPRIRGILYLNPNTIIIVGSSGWVSGGAGFIYKLDPTITTNPPDNEASLVSLEQGAVGELQMVTAVTKNNVTNVWAFGTLGQV